MPPRGKGPRLYLDPKRRTWTIRDGGRAIRTSCAEESLGEAEKALAEYIAGKHRPTPSASPAISDILTVYSDEHVPHKRSADKIEHTIDNLEGWWGEKVLSDVTARNCREYAKVRPPVAARRDLETLRAAIRYWHREYGPLPSIPAVVLPDKPQARDRWLTRSEAAKLLKAARHTPHLARFILLGLYTGSRSSALLQLRWDRIELDRGIMHRRAAGEADQALKRRPPVRLGDRILAHLRRWHRIDDGRDMPVVHYEGKQVRKLRRSWDTARRAAKLPAGISPHTLRHTRATWLMQAGVDIWEAAGSLGMSPRMLEQTYGHHHPDWQKRAAAV